MLPQEEDAGVLGVLSIGIKPKPQIAFVMSCSFTYQVPARLVQLVGPTRSGLLLTKETVAKLHLLGACAKLTVLTQERAHYADKITLSWDQG